MASLRQRVWAWLDAHPDTIDDVTFAQAAQVLLDHGFDGTASTLSTYIQRWARSRGNDPRPPGPKAVGAAFALDDDDHVEGAPGEEGAAGWWSHTSTPAGVMYDIRHASGDHWRLPAAIIADMCRWYTYQGEGLNRRKVAVRVYEVHGVQLRHQDVKRILWALGVVKESPPLPPHQVIEGDRDENIDLMWEAKEGALQVAFEQVKYRKLEASYKQLAKAMADRKAWVDRLAKAIDLDQRQRKTPPATPSPAGMLRTPHHLVVLLSDLHCGAKVEVGRWRFNREVFKARMRQLGEAIQDHLALYRRPLEGVHFALGGDLLEAIAPMRAGHHKEMDLDAPGQVALCSRKVADVINDVADTVACPVNVWSVHGNHDRAGGSRHSDPQRTGHLWLCDVLRLQLSSGVQFTRGGECLAWRVYDTLCMLLHGDETPRETSLPFLPAAYVEPRDNHIMIMTGHRHSLRQSEWLGIAGGTCTHVQNSSLVGPSGFASNRLGKASPPGQVLLTITPDGPGMASKIHLR